MPVDLPLNKTLDAVALPPVRDRELVDILGAVIAALCLIVVLVECISLTPKTYRTGFDAAVYESMLQAP